MSYTRKPEYPNTKRGPDGPSKYTDEFIAQLTGLLKDYTYKTGYPLWSEFCVNTHLPRYICGELCTRSKEFSDAFEEMMAKQESFLQRAGVSGKTNSGFVKFALINNHKKPDGTPYRDKTDHELTGAGGAPLVPVSMIFSDDQEGKDGKE